jgi:hypothetical protein
MPRQPAACELFRASKGKAEGGIGKRIKVGIQIDGDRRSGSGRIEGTNEHERTNERMDR